MFKIRSVLANRPCDYNNIMLWAACCLAFFGFLRCSEFTVPTQDSFDNTTHLSYRDVSVDNWHDPQLISIRIKQSKTSLMLSKTNELVCPVTVRGSFIHDDKSAILNPFPLYSTL